MTIENGGEQPANDTTVADQNTAALIADEQDDSAQDLTDDGDGEGEGEAASAEPELVEVTLEDGRKVKVQKDLEGHILRQADYTRKTQEVAEERRRLEAEREQFKGQTEAQKAHFKAATKIAAIDDQLTPYTKMTPQDWMALRAQDPDGAQNHWINYDFLKNQRETAAREFSDLESKRREGAERENANRIQSAEAELAKLVPGITKELFGKIVSHGTALGIPEQNIRQAALDAPVFVRELNRLRIYDEAAAKQKTQQTVQKTLETKPVPRVGGNGGSAARKTTDSSGDALSTEEWSRREDERLAARAKALGRR